MTIDQERTYIMQHPKYKDYDGWKNKVMSMSDRQVHAIYKKFQNVDYKKVEKEIKAQKKDNANYHQVDMFEYMEELKGANNGVHEN